MKRLKKLIITILGIFGCMSTIPLTACNTQKYTVTLINENEDRGNLIGGGLYKPGKTVTVAADPIAGYKFDKWEMEGIEVATTNSSYSFVMPDRDVTLVGNFVLKSYKVDIKYNYSWSAVEGDGFYEYGSEVTVKCIPVTGYHFVKWVNTASSSTVLSNSAVYTFKMPAKNLNLEAVIERSIYNVNIIVNDPDHIEAWAEFDTSQCFYDVQYSVGYKIKNSSNSEHYSLKGMYAYENGVKGEKINFNGGYFEMPNHDLTIYVEVVRDYQLRVNYVANYEYAITTWMEAGTELSYTAISVPYATYNGWYDKENNALLTTDYTYSFTMPNHDIRIASVYTLLDGDITFGKFPQTKVEDDDLINELDKIKTVNSSGYIEYEGNEYICNKKDEIPEKGILPVNSKFRHDTYHRNYYKVEPIKWYKVGEFDNGITALMSQYNLVGLDLIESDVIDDKLVDYKDSSFRTYLNGNFYENAFSEEEKSNIVKKYIDKNGPLDLINPIETGKDYLYDNVFVPSSEDYRKLPAITDPLQYYLFYGFLSDFSKETSSTFYAYDTTMLTNHICEYSFILRDVQNGYQMYSGGYGGSQYFTQVDVGCDLCVKPMILVKGL